MNKFFAKIAGITAGLALVASAGVALANHAEAKGVRAAEVTDTITASDLAATSTTYTAFSGVSKTSGAVYAGQSAKSSAGAIQLRSKNSNSGIVSTTSGGTVKSVTITVQSGSNTVDVYGSNSAYSAATDLYGTAKGTKVGSVTATGTVTFTDSYSYVGIRSNNGAIYLTSVEVVWDDGQGGGGGSDTYSVTYNKNDSTARPATGMPTNIGGLEDGATASLTGSPSRWGYTFLGWGASASATETISSVTIDGANATVYALWGEDHTVAGAWSDKPYTVAQARTAIDDNENLTDVYVEGTISQVDSYNSTYKSIQYWISDDGTTTNQFEVYSGKGLNGADFSSVSDVEVGAHVIVNGNIKLYSTTYEFDKSSKQIVYDAPSTGDIEVTFAPANFYGVGDNGSFSASTEAANPTYSFSSDNSSVISVTSAGVFEAVAAGSATVRVDVTSSEGNGYKEVAVTVVAVKTVSEAYEIAAGLASGATTDYSIKVSGWVSSLDADGKARAINFTDGAEVIEVFFGGGNADYTTVATNAKIGSEVTVFGKVQNYSGTYELKDITLEGVQVSDAVGFAAGAYKSLDGSCETGVDAVTEDQWTAINNGFNAINPSEQAKFQEEDVTSYGTNVVNWVARYEIIVAHTSLSDFMSRGVSAARVVPGTTAVDSNVAVAVVAIVTIASISAIAVILVIKRRRALEK